MRWAKIEWLGEISYGIVEEDEVALVNGDLLDEPERNGRSAPLDEVRFLLPLIPRTFYAAGMNYVDHVIEQARIAGREPDIPQKPDIGYRANTALIGHNDPIIKPKTATELFQYEGELVAVIGRQVKNISEADALSCVFGYTIGNDISERTWQNSDRTLWRAKNTDSFAPMGPWIETDLNLEEQRTTIRVNGREVISFDTNNMLFGVARYISAMSEYITLYPGDVIWMGTEGKAQNLVPGDVCEIEISGIGTLSNPIVAET